MRARSLLFALIAILGIAFLQCRAANKSPATDPAPAPKTTSARQAQANPPGKVWSNPDLDALRAQGLLSLVGPYPEEVPLPPAPVGSQAAPLAPASETSPAEVPYDRTRDPLWYSEQADQLRTELGLSEAGLVTAAERLNDAQDRNTQPGINLDRGNVGVTPQEGVAILQQRTEELRDQLDQLSDQARRNDIPPGALR